MKWIAAALLAMIALSAQAQDNRSSGFDCGLRLGNGSEQADAGSKYQPEEFRDDYQDVRPLPLQIEAEQEAFTLHVNSDSGERRLMDVITLARFECSLD
ncbi:MAG: hypothetical protein ACPG1A_00600 [Halioglobus sp.]